MSAARFWSRPAVRRATELTLTTVFWFAWIYLILPLVNLLMWALGYQMFVDEMVVRGGYVALLAELRIDGLVVLVMALVMLLWIEWNQRRYGRHNHRLHQPEPLGLAEQAAAAGLTTIEVTALQAARSAHVDFDEFNRLRLHG